MSVILFVCVNSVLIFKGLCACMYEHTRLCMCIYLSLYMGVCLYVCVFVFVRMREYYIHHTHAAFLLVKGRARVSKPLPAALH